MTEPKYPRGLRQSGRRLWKALTSEYELSEHERALLVQACRTVDLLDDLQAAIDADGVVDDTSQGKKIHPAAPEYRLQSAHFTKLVAALQLPGGVEDELLAHQRHGSGGAYSLRMAR